jgi:hypothetical protein
VKLECYRLAHERGVKGSSEVSHDREQQLRRDCVVLLWQKECRGFDSRAQQQQDDYDAIARVAVNTLADHRGVADPGPNCDGPSTWNERIFTGKGSDICCSVSYFEPSTSPLSKQVRFMGQVERSTRNSVLVSVPILEIFKLFTLSVANVFGIHSNKHFKGRSNWNSARIGVGLGDKSCETLSEERGLSRPLTWPI